MTDDRTATANGIEATYDETETERLLEFRAVSTDGSETTPGASAVIAQNVEGYAMLKVRPTADGDELERYYGFDMALDHAGELLGVSPHDLPIPEAGDDMGM
ncbi:DUF7111 family protein [Natronorubrum daqingense]|uniref:Uncharacterized protein n=1 Tax=Natronorubrum daqingense TaxID=588898 RepID=A0A1N6YM93_9EURY|nr:hypothetical protein [Natronorubrum daqingense]APX95620.1 hypothetical protein BB347_02765 [Natronorubrum daqingense]SIR15677.1 hypothetical protein SAMN05421809_0493 [Natronorubrum daqingense]